MSEQVFPAPRARAIRSSHRCGSLIAAASMAIVMMTAGACATAVHTTAAPPAPGPAVHVDVYSDAPPLPQGADVTAILGHDWMFMQITGFHEPLPSALPVAGFILTREATRMTGTTGCNKMTSSYELDPARG